MRRRQPRTLLEYCTATLGLHRGALTAAWLIEHVIAAGDLGHVPSGREYAEWAFIDERTSWRRRASLKQVFGDETWRDVVEALVPIVDAQVSRRKQVQVKLPPAVVVA